jgi:hypothetical protein
MAIATRPTLDHRAAAERPRVLATTTVSAADLRQLEAELGEVLAAGRQLADSINRDLVVPISVLDLLVAHTAVPADLRPMLTAARAALQQTTTQAEQLQAVVQRRG